MVNMTVEDLRLSLGFESSIQKATYLAEGVLLDDSMREDGEHYERVHALFSFSLRAVCHAILTDNMGRLAVQLHGYYKDIPARVAQSGRRKAKRRRRR